MPDSVISVENLSKRYVIGHESHQDNLRDTLHHTARKLWRRFRWGTGFQTEEFWALRDVSFEVKRGEVVGIIGRNGAGKSTLLKILSRITEPTAGRVAIRGRVASLLEVGTGFHPELTGRDNIFLNGAILGMKRAEIRRKFDEIVDFAEVEKFLDTPVKHYSSGMYVRLAFAVAAHLDPEILIVDEVLAVGDTQFQQKCLGKMGSVARTGRTVLFVSHNMKAMEHFCNRGILLEQGRLCLDDTANTAVREYLRRNIRQPSSRRQVASDEMELTELAVIPEQIAARGRLDFIFELHATRDCLIHDLHLLIYNSIGDRIAIVDLREAKGSRRLPGGRRLRIKGHIDQLNLVEGHYRLGFCIRTSRNFDAYYDLVNLQITAEPAPAGLSPYAPEHLGTTLLNYSFEDEIA
jgi:lipopolysaccharide transport system ATP-binding protein